jgi:hypothetical protein
VSGQRLAALSLTWGQATPGITTVRRIKQLLLHSLALVVWVPLRPRLSAHHHIHKRGLASLAPVVWVPRGPRLAAHHHIHKRGPASLELPLGVVHDVPSPPSHESLSKGPPQTTAFTDCCCSATTPGEAVDAAQSNPGCPEVFGSSVPMPLQLWTAFAVPTTPGVQWTLPLRAVQPWVPRGFWVLGPDVRGLPAPRWPLPKGPTSRPLPRDACGDRGPPPTYRIAQKKVRSYRRTELVFGTPPVLIYIHARFSGRYSLRNRIFSCNSTFHCFYRLPSIAVPTRQGEAVDATPRAVQPWMSWGSWAPSPDFGPCPRDRPVVLAKGRLWGQGAAANLQDCTEKSALL